MQVLKDNKVSDLRSNDGSLANHSFAVDNMYENVSIEISKIELTTDERSFQGSIHANETNDAPQLTSRFNNDFSAMVPSLTGQGRKI